MGRHVRVRALFLVCSLATLALTLFISYHAAPNILRTELAGRVDPAVLERTTAAARQAILVGGVLSFFASVFLALGLSAGLTHSLRGLRRAAARLSRGLSRHRIPAFRVVEVDAVANTLSRVARELADRMGELTRERDETALLLNSVGEGIMQLDVEGRVLRVNAAATELLRLPADVEGQPVTTFVRQPEVREALHRATHGEAVEACEVRLDERRLLVAASPLHGEGRRLGAVAVFVDLTEIRRLEGVRRDFVANASHELKTPLTSIRGYAETLLQGDLPEDLQHKFLETIHHNADRLHHIVEDLLDLSRLESGGWRPELEAVDIGAVAEEVWDGFRERAAEQDVGWSVEQEFDAPVPGDRLALRQIFSNLFDNALRYTPAGGRITVRVYAAPAPHSDARPSVERSRWMATGERVRRNGVAARANGAGPVLGAAPAGPDGGPRVVVEVEDTGSGIPRDALDRIFERFYRVDPARSREEGGTGLGLAIVKHLVEQMGGEVSAESELGRGTVVRFHLPASVSAVPSSS